MLNKSFIQGRLTATPELKTTKSGKAVTSFTVACQRDFATQGQEKQSDFINCVSWGKTAEFISRYFEKGKMIIVSGALSTRSYEDRDGKKRYVTELNVDNVQFCGSKSEGTGERQSAPASYPVEDDWQGDEFSDDELPF